MNDSYEQNIRRLENMYDEVPIDPELDSEEESEKEEDQDIFSAHETDSEQEIDDDITIPTSRDDPVDNR
ncbi:hypothetical protein JTB14_031402 [Gonioctena quinquepunctata]|nr:hypothetical protein JTB14_031402 [Gonioctena quinquepunctata]